MTDGQEELRQAVSNLSDRVGRLEVNFRGICEDFNQLRREINELEERLGQEGERP